MDRQELQVIDGKRYIVLECQFRREWNVVMETRETVTQGEALEIVQYWIKYKDVKPEQLKIVEVPDILKK
ncbi:hypothetical protein [Aggregatibacter actinomycetemcomitans]|uniref:hypothetical protein n=1 Tax=Aggregatibacter actinomycetemcomitans TaxID=714 RepID=UPI0002ABDB40|nr:hypothetical protein [Aggregatibacter actinomycetemcomitans]KOE53299.1 hypothetical protein S23A_0207835 [Aggregatibacter actinomycetemcomitans serotype b str. S23A]KOE53497.1 hypothetical protein I23C_0306005 [Aggregatibacter actinomycetemcomitans serotype b str. I23C]TYA23311.1 hypothetical protein FXB91_05095 [Aggregatibacter actinomycetemcomitans]TYA27319.1 hypothetical protein FXB92_04355 [Aggregatibacter actinomycetemcomitans]TYA29171.1 hypothetical protein FXB96_04965 [Aggregatibacte